MRNRNKKGISPLIATVLIIGFTIVLAALVISWGTKLFKTTTEETGKTSEFNLLCSTGYNVEYNSAVYDQSSPNQLSIVIKNKNDKTIPGFYIIAKPSDPKANVISFSTDLTTIPGDTGTGISIQTLPPFQSKNVILSKQGGSGMDGYNQLEIRIIAQTSDLEKKVCENEQKVSVVTK